MVAGPAQFARPARCAPVGKSVRSLPNSERQESRSGSKREDSPEWEGMSGTPATGEIRCEERSHDHDGFNTTEQSKSTRENRPIQQMTSCYRRLQDPVARRLGAERQRRHNVGSNIERENLEDTQGKRDPAARERPNQERRQFSYVRR